MSDLIESFLELYSKPRIKKEYRLALTKFFEWTGATPEQILEEWKTTADRYEFRKKWGNILVKYYNYHLERGVKINTALGYVTPVRAFFTAKCDMLKIKKRALDKRQMAFGEHEFKHSQLQQMYRVGDIREKAILATGVALGYGVTQFITIKRDFLKKIIAQRESEEPPIGFWYQRTKTSQPIRSHVTVESMNALEDYWKIAPESEWAFPNGTGEKHLSKDGVNYVLKSLTKKAKIQTTGQIRWHLLRKFLFSALTNVMAEMNAKLCVGKAIPIDVLTYIKGKTEQLKQEYREAEKYFVLSGFTNSYHTELDTIKEEQARQKEILGTLVDMIAKRVIELQKRHLVTGDTEIQFTLTFNEVQKLLALTKPKKPRPKDN